MNSLKLKAEMVLKGKSVDDICAAAGFSRTAYFRKISGETEFKQAEINAIAHLLSLDIQKVGDIFFEEVVS